MKQTFKSTKKTNNQQRKLKLPSKNKQTNNQKQTGDQSSVSLQSSNWSHAQQDRLVKFKYQLNFKPKFCVLEIISENFIKQLKNSNQHFVLSYSLKQKHTQSPQKIYVVFQLTICAWLEVLILLMSTPKIERLHFRDIWGRLAYISSER